MTRTLTLVTLLAFGCGGGSSPSNPSDPTPTPSQPPVATLVSPPASPSPEPSTPPTPSVPPDPSTPPGTPEPSTPPAPSTPPGPTVRAHQAHAHCGWIGADTAEAGTAAFVAHADWFDAIHPKWFTLQNDGTPRAIAFTDDATVTQTAHEHHVKLIPLIDAGTGDMVRQAMKDPAGHAQLLLDLVTQHGYDGIELDYEHLWTAGDRPGYVALVQAVAAAMHAHGKLVTLALPALDHDAGDNAYDYVALQQAVDTIHLMGYDFHWLGGPHLGPIAPLGWIRDVVTRVESLGAPGKYVLGVANYGIGSGWYTDAADAVAKCGGNYSRATDHMLTCSLGNKQDAGSAPHCSTSQGDVWFEDAVSVGEKATLAQQHHLAGVTYWTVGGEPPGFFDAISKLYP